MQIFSQSQSASFHFENRFSFPKIKQIYFANTVQIFTSQSTDFRWQRTAVILMAQSTADFQFRKVQIFTSQSKYLI